MTEEITEESIFFYEPAFLQNVPLTFETMLDYFAISSFYDKTCTNEIIKMQSQFTKINPKEYVKKMQGVYYEVDENIKDSVNDDNTNNLFVIYKKENVNNKHELLKVYYVMFGHIYCCPSTNLLSDNKLCEILWKINGMLDAYEENKQIDFIEGVNFKTKEKGKAVCTDVDVTLLLDAVKEFVYEQK